MKLWLLVVAAGCGASEPEVPSPNPPPPWGAPITGGTMVVTRDGHHAVIADPDRDRIVTVDLGARRVVAEIALTSGDEPGRVIEDGAGRIHVALRRGGALVTLAGPAAGELAARRAACAEPRGLAYDPATDVVHVACASGELVSFLAAGGEPTRRLRLDRDLRDVVVAGSQLVVTRFRSAQLVTLDAQGAVVGRATPPMVKRSATGGPIAPDVGSGSGLVDAVPAVAWRAVAMPDGGVVLAHQRQLKSQLGTSHGGYGGSCGGGPVEAAVTVVPPGGAPVAVSPFATGALPVDIAVDRTGTTVALAVAGAKRVIVAPATALAAPDQAPCPEGSGGATVDDELGAPSSVAFTPDGALVIYYPELPAIVVHPDPRSTEAVTIALTGELGYDAGRALFHTQTAVGIACASCHPEGRDDGLVWDFAQLGLRRTQSLAGHILARAPYHWGADMADLDVLMNDVFANRMAGGAISRSQRLSLGPWLDRIPAPAAAPAIDPAAVARGKALFDSNELACTTCHAGELLTNNQRADVATGGLFKVPSLLGVATRAPYMHDGCAATLRERFGTCGGGDHHGRTSTLDGAQLADLVAYLEAL